MQQPEGYKVCGKENLVCKLKKSLYQAPRRWNRALKELMMSVGFVESNADPCVFTQIHQHMTIVAVFVDDLILADVKNVMIKTKRLLSERFIMGELHYFPGDKCDLWTEFLLTAPEAVHKADAYEVWT